MADELSCLMIQLMSFVSAVLMLALEVAYVTSLVQHRELDYVTCS